MQKLKPLVEAVFVEHYKKTVSSNVGFCLKYYEQLRLETNVLYSKQKLWFCKK